MTGILNALLDRVNYLYLGATRNNVAKFVLRFMKNRWKRASDVDLDAIRAELEAFSPKPDGKAVWNRPVVECKDSLDLTIIIPFYKTEAYAVRCIESVLTQKTTYSTELILIDDESPDKCGEILDSYAHYENVHVIHQKNKGSSGARNAGMAIARGRYLMFADSDDLLSENAIQVLLDAAYKENADIVEGAHVSFADYGKERYHGNAYKVSTHGEGMFGFCWGKVIRTPLFDRLCFPDHYYYQDTIIPGVLFKLANVTVTIPNVVYKYYINSGGVSIASRKKPKSIETYYIMEELLFALESLNIPVDESFKYNLIYQLGPFVYNRTRRLGKKVLFNEFILASNLLDTKDLYPPLGNDFYMNELIEALKNKQFARWKYAAKYL